MELLVAIFIIGLIATTFVTSLSTSWKASQDRAALTHGQNVFKAAWAYLAEQPNRLVVTGDCTQGYTAGSYSVPPPGATVTFCVVQDLGNGTPQVEVVSASGRRYRLP